MLMDAYNTDVRPLLRELREEQGLDPTRSRPTAAPGTAEKVVAERVGRRRRVGLVRRRRRAVFSRRPCGWSRIPAPLRHPARP